MLCILINVPLEKRFIFGFAFTWPRSFSRSIYHPKLYAEMHFILETFYPPPAESPPAFSNSSCPFVFLFRALWMFYTLLPDYRLRLINVWQVWYKLGVHPRSLLTCSWGVVMLVVQGASGKAVAVISKDSPKGWISWSCHQRKVYHFVSNPFLIKGKDTMNHVIYAMCVAPPCLLVFCTLVFWMLPSAKS